MDEKRRAGAVLIGVAVLLAVASWCWWAWENSDSQQDKRETDALTHALITGGDYEETEPSATVPLTLAGISAVLFVSGVILVAVSPARATPDASDHP